MSRATARTSTSARRAGIAQNARGTRSRRSRLIERAAKRERARGRTTRARYARVTRCMTAGPR